jgi:hypothetical protein
MFSKETLSIIAGVITSWQVIVAAIVAILYISLINYVSRFSRRRSFSMGPGKSKKHKEKIPAKVPESEDEELGLEQG